MRRTILLLLAALAAPVAASAHRGSALTGYVSTVSSLQPNVLGVNVAVLGGDDRLRISNYSGKTVVILGYEREPYLRFDREGIWANTLSPAAHLNRFRRPRPLKPGVADASAPPRWRLVTRGVTYEWHDHRIHWTGTEPPRGVKEHPDRNQRIFKWQVPGTANGRAFVIDGFLGYAPDRLPKDDGGPSAWLLAAAGIGGALLLVAAVGEGARRVRRRAPSVP